MKRLVLLFASVLIGLTTAAATELTNQTFESDLDKLKRYRYAEPIMFVERGVEFLIFPDGSFDFNTNANYNNTNTYNKGNSRRSTINTTYSTSNRKTMYTSKNRTRGVSISHDRDGKVRRIGNVYLNYDRSGKIKRAGNVYMNYNRGNGTLKQVGGLHINYNRWGEIVKLRGEVNRYNANFNVDYKKNHRNNNDWNNHRNDYVYNNDDNYYYFKQNGKVKKQKKIKR